jgi:hypothetical protein
MAEHHRLAPQERQLTGRDQTTHVSISAVKEGCGLSSRDLLRELINARHRLFRDRYRCPKRISGHGRDPISRPAHRRDLIGVDAVDQESAAARQVA